MGPGGGDGGANARIILYFGCGEHVRAGQPVEIDLSRMARGQTPPMMAQMAIQAINGPNATNSATFGEWPNQRSRTTIPANGSLVGAHRIAGNYSPEINFSLAQGQDFLAPIRNNRQDYRLTSIAPNQRFQHHGIAVDDAKTFRLRPAGQQLIAGDDDGD